MLECTFQQFKVACKEFRDNVQTMNIYELDNAWKCLGLMYINMTEAMWRVSAGIALDMMGRLYMDREHYLMKEISCK